MNGTTPALRLTGVSLVRDATAILTSIDWTVGRDERWAILGPNGCGKTSLVQIAALYLHPSSGTVDVLGQQLGRCDVRTLRARIGVASSALADLLRADLSAADVVMTARNGALEPWWHTYGDADRTRAVHLLDRFGMAHLASRGFGTLSSGERQRVQLARTLMADPDLLLLDEPAAGLDIAAREDLVDRLGDLACDSTTPAMVLVTHHVEEIPTGFTHVLLLRAGRIVASGPLDDTLDAGRLSACFGLELDVVAHGERGRRRFQAWRR